MYTPAEERAGWGWGRGPAFDSAAREGGAGLEEFPAWVENGTLSAKH